MSDFRIVQEEPHFLVVDKSAGLFSQAPRGVPSLQVRLTQFLKERDGHEGQPFIGLPHRLDRATSGVMLIARNQRALKRFGQQFQSRKIGKFYLAVVEGDFTKEPETENATTSTQEWVDYVRKIENEPKAETTTAELGKEARLNARILCQSDPTEHWPRLSLLLIQLHTGRMHQIRLQAATRDLPIVGDAVYGSQLPFGSHPSDSREATLALHALRLEFRHPQTAKLTSATSDVPGDWQTLPETIREAVKKCTAESRQNHATAWNLSPH